MMYEHMFTNIDKRRIAEDTLKNGFWVSTVKLPRPKYKKAITVYETAVFRSRDDLSCPIERRTYLDVTLAEEVHKELVEKYSI